MYAAQDGYEIHMMFTTAKWPELAYLTVKCSDILFEDNITLPASSKENPK